MQLNETKQNTPLVSRGKNINLVEITGNCPLPRHSLNNRTNTVCNLPCPFP